MATEDPNRVTILPAGTPALVRRHPALLVEWLRVVNLLSRWRGQGRAGASLVLTPTRAAVFAVSAVVLIAALLTVLAGHAVVAIEMLARYWLLVGVVAAIYAWRTVSRRRRHIEESQSQSWLVATPISPSSLRLSLAIRTLLPVVAILAAAWMFLFSVVLLSHDVVPAAGVVIAALSAGILAGSATGWWLAGRAQDSTVTAPSRYVPRPRLRESGLMRPDASALASWPIAQVLAWSRPENSRYVLIVALLAVQGGSSALGGLSVVAMYFIGSYLAALLSATITVAKLAASWLRSTPMTLSDFLWSLARRALVHQLLGTALGVVCMLLLGAPVVIALQLAALWLGLVISVSGFALVDHYRGRSPLMKIALSVATIAALATMMQLRAGAEA